MVAMSIATLGCLEGVGWDSDGGTDCATGGAGGAPICETPKQIRLIDGVQTEFVGLSIKVRYDSLDPNEPRVPGTMLPTTELVVGDAIELDPTMPIRNETVTVTSVGTVEDNNTGGVWRTFAATFMRQHGLNAPGTTPIADGCPPFKMPVQDVCSEDGKEFYVGATCWQPTCQYGEYVMVQEPEGTKCSWKDNQGTVGIGHCNSNGQCLPF